MAKKTITKRTDNRYEVKVTIGNHKRISVYGNTMEEARKKAKQLKEEAQKYDLTNISKLTVKEYMDMWLQERKQKKHKKRQKPLKAASYDRVEQSCKYQIYPYIGDIRISALTDQNIIDMLENIIKLRSYSTMKKAYYNLNACLTSAVNKGDIKVNPMQDVLMPSESECAVPTKNIRVYTESEIKAIVDECTRQYSNGKYVYRYGYVFVLLLNTGVRLGEILYLKWDSVDLTNNTIYIHGNVSEHKNSIKGEKEYIIEEQHEPKTKSSIRHVDLNKNAVEALTKLKEIIGDDTYVVATENHKIVSPHNMHRIFKSILKKCNIVDANDIIHALRHTFATTLIQKGTNIKTVSVLLGHSDVSTTIRTYYHVLQRQKIEAVHILDDLF